MYYPEELVEENQREKRYCRSDRHLCQASEKRKLLFWTLSIS